MVLKIVIKVQEYIGDAMEYFSCICANMKRVLILVLKEVISAGLGILCPTLNPKSRYYLDNFGSYSDAVVSTFTRDMLTLVLIFLGAVGSVSYGS